MWLGGHAGDLGAGVVYWCGLLGCHRGKVAWCYTGRGEAWGMC